MTTTIEQGAAGLVYATDPELSGVFVAGRDSEEARRMAEQARRALRGEAIAVERHHVHEHESGALVTVPFPGQMNSAQRKETIARLGVHLKTRVLS